MATEVEVYRALDASVVVCSLPPCSVGEVRLATPLSPADADTLIRTSRPDAPVRAWLAEPVAWSAADGRFVAERCWLHATAAGGGS